ncbi:MAG: preprotein translocase subunit SecE [Clostridia bacterium]|nr:preprotein translocase subunit SecE [Clostridia bacterium]
MADETNKKKKHFFKDMKTELKKVTWLTPKQLVNNTTAVIVMVIIVAALVFVLDFTFENINKYGVEGLKTVVQRDVTNTVENTAQNEEEQTEGEDATTENEEQEEGAEVTENSSSEEQE